ncbi:unnamed protein product [Strongylus vulgaris]|uniref:Uncharacterized protein n=1 Tax=Strongylus vulgaris TaxID=40348 RepID=A0A3P7JEN2_STRVU|nr:unnamed protein product [Strongylus vulgaris]
MAPVHNFFAQLKHQSSLVRAQTEVKAGELAVLGIAYPSDAVYKGTDVVLYCCVNMDPQGLIDVAGVGFALRSFFDILVH